MLSCVQLFATPRTVAHHASLSLGVSRQEYWGGFPFPSPGDLPDPGIKPGSPTLQADSLLSEPPGKPYIYIYPLFLRFFSYIGHYRGNESGSDIKESASNAKDPGLIPGSGRSPAEGNSNPLQYSCLENPMDRGAWWAMVHGVAKSWTQLNN